MAASLVFLPDAVRAAEPVSILYFYHSISTDNENRIATGWNDGQLSARGKNLAHDLRAAALAWRPQAVFCSDLSRAADTAAIVFERSQVPVFFDARLRECNYGQLNGAPTATVKADELGHFDTPFPGGESYRQALSRTNVFLHELLEQWADKRVVVIGHGVQGWALQRAATGRSFASIMTAKADFRFPDGWNNGGKGWVYELTTIPPVG